MNVTVIPFLLEALLFVRDVTEWRFGSEYVFQLNKTTMIFMDSYIAEDITAMVKCRPTVSMQDVQNVLSCRAIKIIVSKITRQLYKDLKTNTISDTGSYSPLTISNTVPNQFFEIIFSMQGVQDFKVEESKKKHHYDSIIVDIIEQFNIGFDLSIAARDSMKNYERMTSGSHVISSFIQRDEDTMRASKCNTSCIITYTPHKEFQVRKKKRKFDFQLRLLPISYTDPTHKSFSIERIRMACTHQLQYLMFLNEKWNIHNMTDYSNRMEIYETNPKFTSHTHLEGYVSFRKSSNQYYLFSKDVHLHLLRIRPAPSNISTAEYDYD